MYVCFGYSTTWQGKVSISYPSPFLDRTKKNEQSKQPSSFDIAGWYEKVLFLFSLPFSIDGVLIVVQTRAEKSNAHKDWGWKRAIALLASHTFLVWYFLLHCALCAHAMMPAVMEILP